MALDTEMYFLILMIFFKKDFETLILINCIKSPVKSTFSKKHKICINYNKTKKNNFTFNRAFNLYCINFRN